MPNQKKSQSTPQPGQAPTDAVKDTAPAATNSTTASASASFPIVGVGASAGGLAAFEAFFSGMPAGDNPGMAFVLVQHLAPDHDSILVELVQRTTRLKVFEVKDGVVVQVNCVYIIPPDRDMAFLNGTLQLLEPSEPRGQRFPIDFLFRSMAQDQHDRAIGIVLSGTGSDGTLGVRAIKGEGGMVMAQSLDSCEFDGMPRNAIATQMVDFELSPADMPSQLIAYVTHAFGKLPRLATPAEPQDENSLRKIFVLLRTQTGHDFSQYKTGTIFRRIERRMAVHQLDTIGEYVKYLQQTPVEVVALFRDLLIGVTSFFRDPQAFEMLKTQVIPKLFEGKPPGSTVRVWCTGCSTGEEAYSIAILLQEQLNVLRQNYKVQIFATDIDSHAIATARSGVYPASIARDISAERLERFFTLENGASAYRIHKSIRDMLVFSEHDLIRAPPFSRLDLISCRNLLIYLNVDLQKKLVDLFHYALLPGGQLFLGTSETVGEFGGLFRVLDRKSKIYKRTADLQGTRRTVLERFVAYPLHPVPTINNDSVSVNVNVLPMTTGKAPSPAKNTLREMTEQALLQQITPTGALVNAQGDILYLHGRTGMFLEPTPGDAGVNNILAMAREGLRPDLTHSLRKAVTAKERVQALGVRVKTNGHFTRVDVAVCPVPQGPAAALESPLFLIILQALETPQTTQTSDSDRAQVMAALPEPGKYRYSKAAHGEIAGLQAQLQAKEDYLSTVNEELETSNEELKSSNEELQSVNEELQSSNEELETSKEELQSINEELTTVNTELKTKINDLSRANNDMNNLLAGTDIGTVFLDHSLRIVRFTPAATEIINLIPSDIGRPVGHIVMNLANYDTLVPDVQVVLNTLIPKEVDVLTAKGKSYTLRIRPYRTLENVIEGAVITFVEITDMVHTREALRKANEMMRLAVVVRDAFDAIAVQDLDGRIIAWNPGAVRLYGWTELQALGMNVRDRIPAGLHQQALEQVFQLSQAETLEPYQTQRVAKDGSIKEVSLTSTALVNASGLMYAISTTERAKLASTPKNSQAKNATSG